MLGCRESQGKGLDSRVKCVLPSRPKSKQVFGGIGMGFEALRFELFWGGAAGFGVGVLATAPGFYSSVLG